MLSDSDFGSGTDDQRFWSSGWTEPEEDRSQPIGVDSQSEEENSDRPKCPICLVNSTLNVQTNCGHDFCLQCIFRMWTSENSDNGKSAPIHRFSPDKNDFSATCGRPPSHTGEISLPPTRSFNL